MAMSGDRRVSGPVALAPGVLTPVAAGSDGTRVRWLQADGVRVELLDAGPHRFAGPRGEGEPGTALVVLLVSGEVRGEIDGERIAMRAGDAAFIDVAETLDLDAATDVAMCRYLLDAAVLPAVWHGRPRPPVLLLEPTTLVRACVAFAGGLLDAPEPVSDAESALVAGAVVGVQSALLGEAWRQHDVRELEADASPTRRRVMRHIDAHLADPGLTPTAIAADLGVHVRTVHGAFEGTGSSVAGFVRERRVSAVRSYLWTQDRLPLLDELARHFGLRSRDQLGRTFRAVTGRSVQQWWDETKGAG